jgi:hypothetical protein
MLKEGDEVTYASSSLVWKCLGVLGQQLQTNVGGGACCWTPRPSASFLTEPSAKTWSRDCDEALVWSGDSSAVGLMVPAAASRRISPMLPLYETVAKMDAS